MLHLFGRGKKSALADVLGSHRPDAGREVPMSPQHARPFSRRRFLGVTLAGTAGLLGLYPRSAATVPAPETTRIRLEGAGGTCQAPKYVAEELLRAEGFAR